VGGKDGLYDGLKEKEGTALGRYFSDGLKDGFIEKVGAKVSVILKEVVSVRLKLEAGLITVLSTLIMYHPSKRLPLPNLS